jgi:hypothetical protein
MSTGHLLLLIDQAICELARARREITLSNGTSGSRKLDQLEHQLVSAREKVTSGQDIPTDYFSGAVRWLTDWLPNLDDPLIKAISILERSGGSRLDREAEV